MIGFQIAATGMIVFLVACALGAASDIDVDAFKRQGLIFKLASVLLGVSVPMFLIGALIAVWTL